MHLDLSMLCVPVVHSFLLLSSVLLYGYTVVSSLVALTIKNASTCSPWVRKIPWRVEWVSTPVFLPGEFRGRRSLGSMGWQRVRHDEWLTLSVYIRIQLIYPFTIWWTCGEFLVFGDYCSRVFFFFNPVIKCT